MLMYILGIIAFLIFYKLFKEFGKTQEIIVNMTDADKEKIKNVIENIASINVDRRVTPQDIMQKISEVDDTTLKLQTKFPEFSVSAFLSKAEEMFDAIFTAFANSHLYVLKSMLTDKLYEQFISQIQRRDEKDLRQELLIKHQGTTLDNVQILNKKAEILVTFNVSQMSALVNSEGVSFDNPKRLYRDVIHKWVFERNFGEPNWILTKTSTSQN